ncbi:flagellar biosynthesis protein FlhF [Planomicrobium koreense]|uniref:Flagellar biosynthesis protein FlhF n=1 Tax=Planococcus koreensis TaxID=112331 RepID=A0A7W8CPL0_9BACL|nr:flagellar biosynthesis protein FlhF [Planococcus koreensis]MBB5179292.1 flagellar biosynthesis protein FlhF [Planococcus koreensis]
MRLKTYIVENVVDAIPMIKRDLGSDALILNTKKIKTGGFLGFFQTDKLEVIAAVESKPSEAQKKPAAPNKAPVVYKSEDALAPSVPAVFSSPPEQADDLISELKSIKQFMMQVIEEDRLPNALQPLSDRLTEQEVQKEIQSEILAKLMVALDRNPALTEVQVFEAARAEIIRMIKTHQKAKAVKDPEMVCFIGPTGVGKTTTIAKIAADYMLREEKNVGLITSDTFRIAAVEQLKTYGSILNIPVKVVETSAGLQQAIAELQDCDIILMDTAGRNYQQKQYIEDLERLLPKTAKIQIHLVLSLTSKLEDMKKIIENFKTIKMDQLVLTKKDETSSAGAILNLICRYSIPISYIANGQNVPDDLVAATPEKIADFVLGDNSHD